MNVLNQFVGAKILRLRKGEDYVWLECALENGDIRDVAVSFVADGALLSLRVDGQFVPPEEGGQ